MDKQSGKLQQEEDQLDIRSGPIHRKLAERICTEETYVVQNIIRNFPVTVWILLILDIGGPKNCGEERIDYQHFCAMKT